MQPRHTYADLPSVQKSSTNYTSSSDEGDYQPEPLPFTKSASTDSDSRMARGMHFPANSRRQVRINFSCSYIFWTKKISCVNLTQTYDFNQVNGSSNPSSASSSWRQSSSWRHQKSVEDARPASRVGGRGHGRSGARSNDDSTAKSSKSSKSSAAARETCI